MESVVFYFYEITMGLMVPQIAGFWPIRVLLVSQLQYKVLY